MITEPATLASASEKPSPRPLHVFTVTLYDSDGEIIVTGYPVLTFDNNADAAIQIARCAYGNEVGVARAMHLLTIPCLSGAAIPASIGLDCTWYAPDNRHPGEFCHWTSNLGWWPPTPAIQVHDDDPAMAGVLAQREFHQKVKAAQTAESGN